MYCTYMNYFPFQIIFLLPPVGKYHSEMRFALPWDKKYYKKYLEHISENWNK